MFVNQKRFLLKRTTKRNSLLRHDMGSLPRQTTTDVLNSQSVVEEAVFRSLFRFCNFLVSTRTPDTFDAYVKHQLLCFLWFACVFSSFRARKEKESNQITHGDINHLTKHACHACCRPHNNQWPQTWVKQERIQYPKKIVLMYASN
jgi:hypothetical protein